jgi:hypothetical protein
MRSMTKHASILGKEAYLGFYVGKFPPCSKKICDEAIKLLSFREG